MNPAHGVKSHVRGSAAAMECAQTSSPAVGGLGITPIYLGGGPSSGAPAASSRIGSELSPGVYWFGTGCQSCRASHPMQEVQSCGACGSTDLRDLGARQIDLYPYTCVEESCTCGGDAHDAELKDWAEGLDDSEVSALAELSAR